MVNGKMARRYVAAIAISMGIITIITGYLISINLPQKESKYMVQRGVLDLTDWSMDKEKTVKLDGEWEFYPGQLLEPGEINEDTQNEYISVPGTWIDHLNKGDSSDGAGTYRLVIKVPYDGSYAIKARTIRSSCNIYLNGYHAAQMGNPSVNEEEFIRQSKYNMGSTGSIDGEIELIIQVSNYGHKLGGIIKSIDFGSFESIIQMNSKDRSLDVMIVSACLVLAIYFIMVYLQRNREKYLLYYSGMNISIALYLATMNEQIVNIIYDYDFSGRTKLQIVASVMTAVCFMKFTHCFFKDNFSKKNIDRISIIIFSLILTIFFDFTKPPFGFMIFAQLIGMGLLVFSFLYVHYVLFKKMFNNEDSLEYVFIIATSMLCYWILIGLKLIFEINLGNAPAMTILLTMITIAVLMSHQLQLDFKSLNELTDKFRRYDNLKDEFLAKASHELRTPMHIIMNLTKGLLEGSNGTLNLKQQENLIFMYHEGQRLTRLVEDLLDSSHIKSGEVKLRISSVDVYRSADEIIREIKMFIADDSSVVIENRIPHDFPLLKADPDKFRQIIYNLLHNSVKYTKEGSITVSAHVNQDFGEITIADTGRGIETKYFNEIFDVFYQNNEGCNNYNGLGLGLPIVKNLVEHQGGTINVESEYGKGSKFKFRLPIYTGAGEGQKAENFPEEHIPLMDKPLYQVVNMEREKIADIEKPTILIVDDEPLNQRIILNILESSEYNTVLADNGKEALKAIERNKIDLIVLDLILPDIPGDKVCEIIRHKYSMTEVPILILTASGRTVDLANSFNYGANDFQRKPIDGEELKSRIQSLLLMKKSVEDGLEKEFQYFYSQISPHFLYNTLNTIIGLSYVDGEKVREALSNLSIYFRGKLEIHRKRGLITLESELEMMKAYVEIEQMRYGDRLEVEYDIEENLHAMIPPLTLQPIAENAVRHGIILKPEGGRLKITAKKDNEGYIKITIEDNGNGMSQEKQQELHQGENERIGFKNVVEKIKILKGAYFKLDSELGVGTKAEILIPEVNYHESHFS